MGGEGEAGLLPAERGFELAVARLWRAAGLRGHDCERGAKARTQRIEHAVDAVGVGVVDEMNPEFVRLAAERVGDELRAEGRAADADAEEVGELASGAFDLAGVHLCGEAGNGVDGGLHFGGNLRVGRELRSTQPVVADHALLVWIGDGAFFERSHVGERLGHGWAHLLGETSRGRGTAEVERDAEFGEVLELLPEEVEGVGHGRTVFPATALLGNKKGGPPRRPPFHFRSGEDLSRRR